MVPFESENPNATRTVPNAILLYGVDEVEYDDLPAAEEIRLGANVERVGGQFQLQSTDGALTSPWFAIPRPELGQTPHDGTDPIELADPVAHDRYPAGDTVFVAKLDKGQGVLGLLADGNAVTDGDALLPNGDGTFRALDTSTSGEDGSNSVLMAVEDFDNTGESNGADYVRMEVTS